MVEVSNHSCLPQQKVEVVATNSAWSLSMPLSVFPFLGNCRDDPALCCYACCFPTCIHAEIAEYNGIEGLCHTKLLPARPLATRPRRMGARMVLAQIVVKAALLLPDSLCPLPDRLLRQPLLPESPLAF